MIDYLRGIRVKGLISLATGLFIILLSSPFLEGKPVEEFFQRSLDYPDEEEVWAKMEEILYNYPEEESFGAEDIQKESSPPFLGILTTPRALEDVEYLFGLLKYGYGGYQLFGGDEGFAKAKQEIKSQVREGSFFSLITAGRLEEIIVENLSFVNDGHMVIGNHIFHQHHQLHMNRDLLFSREGEEFFLKKEGEEFLVKKIADKDPSNYLEPSLDQGGEIVFRPVQLIKETTTVELEMVLENPEGEELKKEISLSPVERERQSDEEISSTLVKDIPVYRLGTFNLYGEDEDYHRVFSLAEEAWRKSVSIIDIRSNIGGKIGPAQNWIAGYTGKTVDFGIYCVLWTETARRLLSLRERGERIYNYWASVAEKYPTPARGWAVQPFYKPEFIENERLLVVLVDSFTISSAERFVGMLRQIENTVIIGTNTGGINLTGIGQPLELPNSGIRTFLSNNIFLPLDLELREGKGFRPDFWVPGCYALEKAVSFIYEHFPSKLEQTPDIWSGGW